MAGHDVTILIPDAMTAPDQPQPESLFSIQFVPAYLIAVPARLLGISSSTAFIALGFLVPLLQLFSHLLAARRI